MSMQTRVEVLLKKDRLKLLEFIHDIDVKLFDHGDGTRININTLTKTQISLINRKITSLSKIIPPLI